MEEKELINSKEVEFKIEEKEDSYFQLLKEETPAEIMFI